MSYDLLKDFAPVVRLPANPQLIVSKKNVPAANLKELIAWLKANESKAAAGTAGAGSASRIAEIYFQKITGALTDTASSDRTVATEPAAS